MSYFGNIVDTVGLSRQHPRGSLCEWEQIIISRTYHVTVKFTTISFSSLAMRLSNSSSLVNAFTMLNCYLFFSFSPLLLAQLLLR